MVDDDPDMIDTLRAKLEKTGHVEVESAETIEGALEKLRSLDPLHLVICDLRLGGAHGVEFLREVRRVRPEVRRMLLTAYSKEGRDEKGVRPDDADWIWEKDQLFSGWPEFQAELRRLMSRQ